MPDGTISKITLIVALLVLGLILVQRLFFDFMAQRPSDYAGTGPAFDLQASLDGPLVSHGVLFGPNGRMVSRFIADMEGRWDATGGTLSESFRFDSGRTQQREWKIVPGADGRFTATAADVVGTGEGQVSGATAMMTYRLRLPEEAGGWEVDVTDWLYRSEDGTIVNRSQFRRFGIHLGELVGTIRPAGQ